MVTTRNMKPRITHHAPSKAENNVPISIDLSSIKNRKQFKKKWLKIT